MDWSKAKTILIVTLLILNIFLLLNLNLLVSNDDISDETIANTVKILEGRGIALQCEIPRMNTDPGKLTFNEQAPFNKGEIAAFLLGTKFKLPAGGFENGQEITDGGSKKLVFINDNLFEYTGSSPFEAIDMSAREHVEAWMKECLDRFNMPSGKYFMDYYTTNPDGSITAVYREKFQDFVVFENQLKVTADKNGVLSLKCGYKSIESLRNPGTRIISAYQILLKEYGGVDGPETITDIDLGFKDSNPEQDMKETYKQPAWRIRTQDGNERFFKATNGEEIT